MAQEVRPRRGRRIYFRGGVWDGYRVVTPPLLPELSVSLDRPSVATTGYHEPEPYSQALAIDVYYLVRYTDHTGIPELQYHLKEMRR